MVKDDETKDAALSFRVRASLKSALERLAAKDRRPLSSYLEIVLEDHVKRAEAAAKRRQ